MTLSLYFNSSLYPPLLKQVSFYYTSNYISVCLTSALGFARTRTFAYWFLFLQSICCINEYLNEWMHELMDEIAKKPLHFWAPFHLTKHGERMVSFKATVFVITFYSIHMQSIYLLTYYIKRGKSRSIGIKSKSKSTHSSSGRCWPTLHLNACSPLLSRAGQKCQEN